MCKASRKLINRFSYILVVNRLKAEGFLKDYNFTYQI